MRRSIWGDHQSSEASNKSLLIGIMAASARPTVHIADGTWNEVPVATCFPGGGTGGKDGVWVSRRSGGLWRRRDDLYVADYSRHVSPPNTGIATMLRRPVGGCGEVCRLS